MSETRPADDRHEDVPGDAPAGDAGLVMPGEPTIGVYGAPRPAVPERVPMRPRYGCGSGAGAGIGADAAAGPRRRLPEWLKIRLPGEGDYADTKALLRRGKLATVCEEARCPNLGHC